MPDATDRLALLEIVEAASLIRQFIRDTGRDDFLANQMMSDAVALRVFVAAEAAGRMSDAAKLSLGSFPWEQIRGVRNRIAHGYGTVSFERIWQIAATDMPQLEMAARGALAGDPDLPP